MKLSTNSSTPPLLNATSEFCSSFIKDYFLNELPYLLAIYHWMPIVHSYMNDNKPFVSKREKSPLLKKEPYAKFISQLSKRNEDFVGFHFASSEESSSSGSEDEDENEISDLHNPIIDDKEIQETVVAAEADDEIMEATLDPTHSRWMLMTQNVLQNMLITVVNLIVFYRRYQEMCVQVIVNSLVIQNSKLNYL